MRKISSAKFTVLHGCDKDTTAEDLALIIAKQMVEYLPEKLCPGSSVKVDIEATFFIPFN